MKNEELLMSFKKFFETLPSADEVASNLRKYYISNNIKMKICQDCGNKRCNKSVSKIFKCTGTNDVNQPKPILEPGSFYAAEGYEKLAEVLVAAHDQAAHGKGKERHANDLPFHEQRMQSISKLIGSPKGLEFQAIKKLTEGMQFDDAARREKELLGAINYIAGIIIYYRNGGV